METDHVTGRPAADIIRPFLHGKGYVGPEGTGEHEASGYVPSEDDHALHLADVQAIDYCSTCHLVESFCVDCHGMEMPHPEADIEITTVNPENGVEAARHADFMTMTACFRCHTLSGESPSGAEYTAPGTCSACHPADFDLKPANHDEADFYGPGHAALANMETDHVTGRPAADIIRPFLHGKGYVGPEGTEEHEASEYVPSDDDHALHLADVQAIDYCSTCHLVESFCVDCHSVEMPHPDGFVDDHAEVGKSSPESCVMCHAEGETGEGVSATEFCNGCHHKEGDPTQPWLPQHDDVTRQTGAEACFECHEPTYCAYCHVRGGQVD
jgi:hypothetical protein